MNARILVFTVAEPEAQLLPISIIPAHTTIQHTAVAKAGKETEKSSPSNGLNYRKTNGVQQNQENANQPMLNGRYRNRINSGENVASPIKLPISADAFKGTVFEFSSPLNDTPSTGRHPL